MYTAYIYIHTYIHIYIYIPTVHKTHFVYYICNGTHEMLSVLSRIDDVRKFGPCRGSLYIAFVFALCDDAVSPRQHLIYIYIYIPTRTPTTRCAPNLWRERQKSEDVLHTHVINVGQRDVRTIYRRQLMI